jgi:hypothetical protein
MRIAAWIMAGAGTVMVVLAIGRVLSISEYGPAASGMWIIPWITGVYLIELLGLSIVVCVIVLSSRVRDAGWLRRAWILCGAHITLTVFGVWSLGLGAPLGSGLIVAATGLTTWRSGRMHRQMLAGMCWGILGQSAVMLGVIAVVTRFHTGAYTQI